ncbi:hypothetical protein [Thermoleophilum album]|uniref:Uncharacterized protein n=1 Tax=Thermoleophilum album TaxID=29539 RepID=A0A1H6FJZ4_THEAL|nr:hypothetical protein [Thermoleophilum album]SEH10155.1 hypothetical protein SAMN02745716_0001 [Thermoleophilum album]
MSESVAAMIVGDAWRTGNTMLGEWYFARADRRALSDSDEAERIGRSLIASAEALREGA